MRLTGDRVGEGIQRRLGVISEDIILMAHGSGGRATQEIVQKIFQRAWNNSHLDQMLDGSVLELPSWGKTAVTTDSYVITPRTFAGGDIGRLSICGTVNDLVACGAVPLYLTVGFIIEEGFSIRELTALVDSMAHTANEAGVKIVTGDTKVVEKGAADGIYINTTGLGVVPAEVDYRPQRICVGDRIIVTGTVGDHGLALMAQREGISLTTPIKSDCAPLHRIGQALQEFGPHIHCLRDPTRGGLATILNELAHQSGRGFLVREQDIPISRQVQGGCDLLGLDPLYLANEGKMVIIVESDWKKRVLRRLRELSEAADSTVIGEVLVEPPGMVLAQTDLGIRRILGMLEAEHLPRIC